MGNAKLTPQQIVFCTCYTQNTELFGNATLSYAEAYNFKLDELSREKQKDDKGKEIDGSSEYEKANLVCRVNGARLLTNANIQKYIRKCLNKLLRDDIVDAELVKVILQNYELPAKVAAIREYNKLKQRIVEKGEIEHKGKVTWVEEPPK